MIVCNPSFVETKQHTNAKQIVEYIQILYDSKIDPPPIAFYYIFMAKVRKME